MAIVQALLPEFDLEMAGVRKTLERVPEDKFDWRPHPKSARNRARGPAARRAAQARDAAGSGRDVRQESRRGAGGPCRRFG